MALPASILSLFSGAGGLDLAVRRCLPAARVVCYVEREAYAAGVLAARARDGILDDAPIWSDVRSFDCRPWRGLVDLVCGGFPCTDVSDAGKRAGIDGEHSGLWREYARIVADLRPGHVFVENVAALRSRGLGRVLRDLAAIGYDAEWACIRASDVGAPHRRDRIFVLARLADAGRRELRDEPRGRGGPRGRGEAELAGPRARMADAGCRGLREPGKTEGEQGLDADGRGAWLADADGDPGRPGSGRVVADAERPERGPRLERGSGLGEGDRSGGAEASDRARVGGASLADASRGRRRKGLWRDGSPRRWPEPADDRDRVADASREGLSRRESIRSNDGARAGEAIERDRRSLADSDDPGRRELGGGGLPDGDAPRGDDADGSRGLPRYPPRPGDRAAWDRVLAVRPDLSPSEPKVRGVDHGMARGVDLARADREWAHRLRACGNGVVPDQAERALRELWRRLGAPFAAPPVQGILF